MLFKLCDYQVTAYNWCSRIVQFVWVFLLFFLTAQNKGSPQQLNGVKYESYFSFSVSSNRA
jgi:hypothetical protein